MTCRPRTRLAVIFLVTATVLAVHTGAGRCGAQDTDSALDLYYSANSLCSRRFYKLAVTEYKTFLTRHPTHAKVPKAQWGLAISLYNLADFKEAEPLLAKLVDNKEITNQELVHNLLGSCLLALNRPVEAEKALAWTIENAKDPKGKSTANARAALTEAMFLQSKWKRVIEVADEMLTATPESPYAAKVRYQGAVARAKLKLYVPAGEVFEAIIKAGKDPVLVHRATFQQAECMQQMNKLAGAAALYEIAAKTKKGVYSEHAHYNLGLVRFLQKDYANATVELKGFIKAYPKSTLKPQSQLHLGRAQLETKVYKDAEELLKPLAAANSPVAASATLWLARVHSRQKAYPAVVTLLTPAVTRFAKDPELPGMLYELATAQMKQGKFAEAAAVYANALTAGTGDQKIEFMRLQAFCLHRAGKFTESLAVCDTFLTDHAADAKAADVLFLQAENLLLLKKFDEALPVYTRFVTDSPNHARTPLARFRMAEVHCRHEKWAGAIKDLWALLAGDHSDAVFDQAWYMAGDCHFRLEQWDKAIPAFETFIKDKPKEPNVDTAMYNLALAYQRKGQSAKAMTVLTGLIETKYGKGAQGAKPLLQKARVELGRLLYEANDYAKARALLLQAVAAKTGEAEYYLGWIALKENKPADAAKYFAVLSGYPDHPFSVDAALQCAILQIRENKLPEAQTTLANMIKSSPTHAKIDQATYYLGLALARQGQFAPALKHFQTILTKHPQSDKADNALYWQARCNEKVAKKPDASIEMYKQFLTQFPNSEMVTDVTIELAKLEFDTKQYAEVIERLTPLVVVPEGGKPLLPPALHERSLYLLGWSHFRQKKLELAATAFEALVAMEGKGTMKPSAYFQAGEARMKLSEYEAACKHFGAAVAAGPGSSHEPALLRRAECEALSDQWPASQKTCELFLQTYAKGKLAPRAQFAHGWALENQKQYPLAIASYRKVTALGKNDALSARSQFQIGECLFSSKKLEDAIKEFIRVESKYSFPDWTSKAILELGRIREVQGKEKEAMARYAEVMKRFPKTPAAAAAKSLLAKLE